MHAGRKSEERRRLLHIVIVGGGPTGVEFAGELSNLVSSVSGCLNRLAVNGSDGHGQPCWAGGASMACMQVLMLEKAVKRESEIL